MSLSYGLNAIIKEIKLKSNEEKLIVTEKVGNLKWIKNKFKEQI